MSSILYYSAWIIGFFTFVSALFNLIFTYRDIKDYAQLLLAFVAALLGTFPMDAFSRAVLVFGAMILVMTMVNPRFWVRLFEQNMAKGVAIMFIMIMSAINIAATPSLKFLFGFCCLILLAFGIFIIRRPETREN